MKESVIYQDILQKGEEKGKKEGRKEGREEGREEGEKNEAFRFLSRQLNRKFGAIDTSILQRLQALTTEQLEALGEDFLNFSNISDLEAWLNR